MRLRSIELTNVRSFPSAHIDFSRADSNVCALMGDNGIGKTNVIEAIALLGTGNSCLGAEMTDVVAKGADFFRVRGDIDDAGEASTLEVVVTTASKRERAFFVNDVRVSFQSFLPHFPIVLFLPRDADLLAGPPKARRAFLDRAVIQTDPDAALLFAHYQKILKQRGALLRRIAEGRAHERELVVWDAELASVGARIRAKRSMLLAILKETAPSFASALHEHWKNLTIIGEQCDIHDDVARHEARLRDDLVASRGRDCALLATTVGPHRDDWSIADGDTPLASFASRGQLKTIFVALLLSIVDIVHHARRKMPVVLLDDVLSELDQAHQSALLRHLGSSQTILTATHFSSEFSDVTAIDVARLREVTATKEFQTSPSPVRPRRQKVAASR
jgi:DNA replication and repair protein RecF